VLGVFAAKIVSHTLKGMLANLAVTKAAASAVPTRTPRKQRRRSCVEKGARGIRTGSPRLVARDGDLHDRDAVLRILIADDEALSRRLSEKTLTRAGYEVTAFENGRLAVEHLRQPDGPRLALLDWVMPELDGPGVCREIRKLREK